MTNISIDLRSFLNKMGLFVANEPKNNGVFYFLSDCELEMTGALVLSPYFLDSHELYKWIRENKQILEDQFLNNP